MTIDLFVLMFIVSFVACKRSIYCCDCHFGDQTNYILNYKKRPYEDCFMELVPHRLIHRMCKTP